jgi:glycosyltransferase involved in cell wall biosynthesis
MMRPRPRVLHLFSGWERTGPGESIVNLCRLLGRRGLVADLACARAPGEGPAPRAGAAGLRRASPPSLEQVARERQVEPILDFRLQRSVNLFVHWPDIYRMIEFLDREEVEIVHVHTAHDHYIGSRAARRANSQPHVVRTNHSGAPLPPTWINRRIVRGHTDGWVALSPSCVAEDARNFHLNPACGIAVEAAVDLERFNPAARHRDIRPDLGFKPDHVVAGVFLPPQSRPSREVLWKGLEAAMRAEPALRAFFPQRDGAEAIAPREQHEPGVADRLCFAGDRPLDEVDCLAAMDFEVLLEPGSDGSCPEARQAMAMGRPVIAGRRGLLPELVEDGRCGLVVADGSENLAAALIRLARDRPLREKLGRAAAVKAKGKFGIERQVEAIEELYLRIVEGA